jgi:hypothetical protein
LSQRHRRPVQNPPQTNTTRGGDRQRMRLDRPRWGSREVRLIRSGGLEEGSGGTASQPSRDHVASDLEIQAISSASSSRPGPQSDGRQESAAGMSSESKRAVALRHISHRSRRIFRLGERGLQGKVELAEA